MKYLMAYIAGDIALSENAGAGIKKWRNIFGLKQSQLAKEIGVAPSVISDYERGRRHPGSRIIKRIVQTLINIDKGRGYEVCKKLSLLVSPEMEAVIDIKEFSRPVPISRIIKYIEGDIVYGQHLLKKAIYGYTVLDSIKAILSMSGYDFFRLMGLTSARAVVFTNVSRGRSPMIAIRVYPIKPSAVILHGPKDVRDALAIEIAKIENLPLILSRAPSIEDLIRGLRKATS